jgi:peptidoglycan/LPS O-acetylase OafA/YrhL
MVLVFHFWGGMSGLALPRPVQQILRLCFLGQHGVELFFVLSGFLITGILLRTKGSQGYLRNFYVRRVLRIFPLYYAVVFICLLVGWVASVPQYAWHTNWWYLFYLQNVVSTFWPVRVAGAEHFWSLAVEEHFYLFWPLLVLILSRRGLALFAVAAILLAGLCRVVMLWAGYNVLVFTLCRLDTLSLGALLAICFRDVPRWNAITVWTRRLYVPAFLIGIPAFFIYSGSGRLGPVEQGIKAMLFTAFCGGLLILALDSSLGAILPRIFVNRSLRFVGKISYGMYVFHPFLFGWLWRISTRYPWSPFRGHLCLATLLDFLLSIGATLLAAWLSWVLLESRILKLKARFQYQQGSDS